MKRVFQILIISFIQTASFAQGNKGFSKFIIKGSLSGFSDSTMIILSDLSTGSYNDIDSIYLIDSKFKFAGTLPHKVTKAAIRAGDFSNRTTFWVEGSEMRISAEKGKFKDAIIEGSKTQQKKYELDGITNTSKNKKADYIQFIQNNPTSIVSADLLNIFSSSWNKDTVATLYNSLSMGIRNTIYGRNISEFLTLSKSPQIGDKFIDFSQANNRGEIIRLSDFQGKIVLLEFWGSWCAPCRQGHPELVKIYNEFQTKGFEILGVAADDKKKFWLDAITKDGLIWQNVCDLKGDRNEAALIYGISYYPANFLIDRTGIIIARDLRDEKLREKLKEILK